MKTVIPFTTQPSHWDDYDDKYAGLRVASAPWPEESGPLPEAGSVAWRVYGSNYIVDPSLRDSLDWFFEHVDTTKVKALVVGPWEEPEDEWSDEIVTRLVAEAGRLPALRAMFFGAITSEHAELSWIQQADITPLLTAFPRLQRLEVRGGNGLRLRPVRHEALRMLRVETGGLPGEVVRGLAGSDLPALEFLELWLGAEYYGCDATIGDLAPILSGERLPALRHLRLQNSEFQDEIAAALASAPIVPRLESLSLSMGTLGDEGAEALLSGQPLTHLRQLNLDHHFMSEPMMERIVNALPGVDVVVTGRPDDDNDDSARYVAVSE